MVDIAKVDEEAAQLERDLVAKERETLDGLKQLETTKNIVKELKSKLQKEAFEINKSKTKMANEGMETCTESLIPVMMEPVLGKERMQVTSTIKGKAEEITDTWKKSLEEGRY